MSIEKILKLAILAVLVFIVGYVGYQQVNKNKAFNEQGKLEALPRFHFPIIGKAGHMSRGDLRGGKTVVVYFSPDCEHCQALAADLGRNVDKIADIDFLFVTRFDEADAIAYARKAGLWGQKNFHWGLDVDAAFYAFFGEMFIPSAYVFNEDGKFLQSLHQNTMTKDILDVLAGIPSDKNKGTR